MKCPRCSIRTTTRSTFDSRWLGYLGLVHGFVVDQKLLVEIGLFGSKSAASRFLQRMESEGSLYGFGTIDGRRGRPVYLYGNLLQYLLDDEVWISAEFSRVVKEILEVMDNDGVVAATDRYSHAATVLVPAWCSINGYCGLCIGNLMFDSFVAAGSDYQKAEFPVRLRHDPRGKAQLLLRRCWRGVSVMLMNFIYDVYHDVQILPSDFSEQLSVIVDRLERLLDAEKATT